MSEVEVKESQKTVVSFIAGLLAGGLLVWIFTMPGSADAPTPDDPVDDTTEVPTSETTSPNDSTTSADTPAPQPELPVGEVSVSVSDQAAGSMVRLDEVTFPTDEGWIAVRSYENGQLGSILGAIQYSKAGGRVPSEIPLLAPTITGRTYAIVFFTQDQNRAFNLDGDVQMNTPLVTFAAQ